MLDDWGKLLLNDPPSNAWFPEKMEVGLAVETGGKNAATLIIRGTDICESKKPGDYMERIGVIHGTYTYRPFMEMAWWDKAWNLAYVHNYFY